VTSVRNKFLEKNREWTNHGNGEFTVTAKPIPRVKLSIFSKMRSLIPGELFHSIVKKSDTGEFSNDADSRMHLFSMLFATLSLCDFSE